MPDQVPEAVKHERAAKLLALGNQLEENYVSTLVGTVQDVLFETAAGEAEAEGYTGQYVRVRAKAQPASFAGCAYSRGRERSRAGKFSIDGR